jgi:ribosome-binding protein aMBF1 (putative translation factor)
MSNSVALEIVTVDEALDSLTEDAPAMKRLATAVKRARERRGWSQANLAQCVGTSRDVIKRLEAGTHDARWSVLSRVLPVLELDEADLQKVLWGQKGASKLRRTRKGDNDR